MTEPVATQDYPFLLAVHDALLDLEPALGMGDVWYISDVWDYVSQRGPWKGRSLPEFQRWIVDQNRQGNIILRRADLPALYDQRKLSASAIRYGISLFDLVNGADPRMASLLRELRHEREMGAARARARAARPPSSRPPAARPPRAPAKARAAAKGGPRYRTYVATVKEHNRQLARAHATNFGTIERQAAIPMPPEQWESLPKGSQDSELDWLRRPAKYWKAWADRHEENARRMAELRAQRVPEDSYEKELALMRARRR